MNQNRNKINKLKRLKNSLYSEPIYLSISELETNFRSEEFAIESEFQKVKSTFEYMINYFAQDMPDPQRGKIYSDIRKDLLNITDLLIEYYKSQSIDDMRNVYTHYNKKVDILHLIKTIPNNIDNIETLFWQLWMTDKFDSSLNTELLELMKEKKLRDETKSVLVSAVTLSLFRVFDSNKFILLFHLYYLNNGESSIRALVGIVYNLFIHEKRYLLYEELGKYLSDMLDNEEDMQLVELVILQHIKAQDTENIIKEFNEDLLPEMMKIQGDLEDDLSKRLDIEDIASDNMMDDENPGWENYFDKNPELFEKMEQFTMRQFNGSDVFSATLGNLKNFDFFYKISNWFLPFSENNEEVKQRLYPVLGEELAEKFLQTFSKASYFCNSDKFSFCLHIPEIQEAMRETSVKLIIAEVEGAEQMLKEDASNDELRKIRDIIVRYIQDLYRFFNFNNIFKGFSNLFKYDIGVHKNNILGGYKKYNEIVRAGAELYLKQKMFYNAALAFEKAVEYGANEQEVYEKAGFCWQKLGVFDKSLEQYKKAELFGEKKKWLYKKIAFSYLKIKKYKEALEYYQKAELEDAEDTTIQSYIGKCFMYLGDYDKALKYFFKVDFFKPNKVKTMRSISYCLFMLKKYEQAEKYAQKCIDKEPNSFDFFLLGNLNWVKGEKSEAIDFYITAMSEYPNLEGFINEFNEHKVFLQENNISEIDIMLMTDFLTKKYLEMYDTIG